MSVFTTDLMKGEVACAGVRGLQRMRRSRSTSSIGRTQGKVRNARDFLCKQPCESSGIGTMLLKSAIGNLGLDLMLPPTSVNEKANNVLRNCHPLANEDKAKRNRTIIQAELAPDKENVWVPVTELPGSVESTPCAWRSFCKEIYSYEEVFAMTGELQEPQRKPSAAGVCRYYFSNPIQFYEDLCFVAGCDDAVVIDDEVVALRRAQTHACRYLFCKEIHSYEEIFSLFGDACMEFDDQFTVSVRADSEDQNTHDKFCHFFGRPIESYEELHSLVGTCSLVLDECALTNRVAVRSFYGKEISSYEELLSLASHVDTRLDDECSFSFYCRSINSYEELYSLFPDGAWELDPPKSQ